MKSIWTKLLTLTLCALMIAVPLAGLAEEITVTAMISSGSGILPPEENFVIDALEAALGFNVEINVSSNVDDYANRKATLTAARNLPDIIACTRTELKEMVENGAVLPLDALLAAHGPTLLSDKEGYFAGYTFDGQIYGIPSGSSEGLQPFLLGIRQDWLDNLELAVPTTIDEFYDVMVAFTKNDPDGNGEDDTSGLCISMGSMGTFYCFPEIFGMSARYYNLVDGQVVPNLLHPNYIELIKFYQKLYQEGLMEHDFATKPWIQSAEALWAGQFGAIVFGPIGTSNNWASRYTDPNAAWVYVNLAGPDGNAHGFDLPRADLSDCVAINASCAHPEAAIQLLDYAVGEAGQDLLILGTEGKHYQSNDDGSITYLSPYAEDITLQRNEGGYAYTSLIGSLKNNATMKTLNQVTRDAMAFGYANPYTDSAVLYTTPEIELEIGGLLDDIQKEALASLIVSAGDIEAELQSYIDKWMRSGGAEWIEQATAIYNSQVN